MRLNFNSVNIFFLILLSILIAINLFLLPIPVFTYVFLILLWFTLTSIGSFNILWNYHLKSLSFNPKEKGRKIALTFDDGPHPIYTPKVLALLEEHGMKATFFCIGKNIEAYPEIVKRIVTAGHSIGNHTYSHSDFFDFYGENVVLEELKTTNDLVERLTNKKMKFFRPPYGVTNPSIKKALIRSNHVSIGWNVRSLDTVLKQKEKIIQRITDKLKAGDIVLLHDTKKQTIEALEDLLPFIQKQNFEAVTVDTLFKIKCYE